MPFSETHTRAELERAGSVHWFHWLIVSLSLGLTLGAWYFARGQAEQKRRGQFEREADSALRLVQERMAKYEDALWGGVALMDVMDGDVSNEAWHTFADSLRIQDKYPGISGIGVIQALKADDLPPFLARQRTTRPDFAIYPAHDESDFFPITFIEPVATNAPAVGLDIAHESNRYRAALRARDTGDAQITAPIVLVQGETTGFLLYVPYYSDGISPDGLPEPPEFKGMVYAPFVFENLMDGILANDTRHVSLQLSDGNDVLFEEHSTDVDDYDPDPLYARTDLLELYGREWAFDIRSSLSFREAHHTVQPLLILIGGLVIDAMLIALFFMISRANRKALALADSATSELKLKAADLERSNEELERFAYVASHDLQEPLRMVSSFATLLNSEYGESFDETGERWLGFMVNGAERMQRLVQGLLTYSRVGSMRTPSEAIDTNATVAAVLGDLQQAAEEAGATVTCDDLPSVHGLGDQLQHVFQNLIANAIKFRRPDHAPEIHVSSQVEGTTCTFSISDDGIGIEEQYADRVFVIFQRLHAAELYQGTGIGLAISKKVVEAHQGRLWFESSPGDGTTFYFTVPLTAAATPTPKPPIPRRKLQRVSA